MASTPPPAPPILPPVPTPVPSSSSLPSSQSGEPSTLKNPGEFEELGKKIKEQHLPNLFDGCKIALQKGLSKHFQTSHSLILGSSSQPAQWQFGSTYVGSKKVGPDEHRPVLLGEISTTGNFSGMFIHQLGKAWKVKCSGQTHGSRWVAYQGALDYVGSDYTASLTIANPNIFSKSGVAVGQYLQSFTQRLALGSELIFQSGGGMEGAMLSLGGRYGAKDWEATARVGVHAWNLSYIHKANKNLSLVAECDGSLMQGESSATLGFKMDVGDSLFTVKGCVNSKWTVGTVIEKRLEPLPASLLISGQLNHTNDEATFGVGFTIG